ncbi:MAG: heme o synthase [Rhodospirillaceae bacterium]
MTFNAYLQLCKPRIGFVIMLTAVTAYLAVAPEVDGASLAILAVAMLLGSSSSSVFNHFYDRDIDQMMARTRNRPLAAGDMVHPERILWFAVALLVAGVGLAAAALNFWVAAHLFLGAFVYGIVYTVWLKRRTWWNIVIGGAAGSFAVLAGAAAADPNIWLLPWLMAIILFLWTPSHFWALAILLKDDYRAAGIPMLPCLVGEERCAQGILLNTILLLGSAFLPVLFGELGLAYAVVTALFSIRFLKQNIMLARHPGLEWAKRTFLGSMVWLLGVFLAMIIDTRVGPMLPDITFLA